MTTTPRVWEAVQRHSDTPTAAPVLATGVSAHDALNNLADALPQFSPGWEACLRLLDGPDRAGEARIGDVRVAVSQAGGPW